MVDQTNVGLLGYSEGDGHPYSFAAIINGYDAGEMQQSPYPGIADYLDARGPEEYGIGDFKVTHVWAPDRDIAQNIADCTGIKNVVQDYKSMAEEVEAVLILRDDADSHRELAGFFLEKDIPVFLDKPLCDNLEHLAYFEPWLDKGMLMSCSGFRYYPAIVNRCEGQLSPDEIVFSHCVSIIDWYRYGIHVLEGITPVMGADIAWVQDMGEKNNHIVRVQYQSGKYVLIQVNTDLGFVLRSSFYTGKQHFTINYDDNFSCFRGALKAFYEQFKTGIPAIDPEETKTIIQTLVAANASLNNSNKRIKMADLMI